MRRLVALCWILVGCPAADEPLPSADTEASDTLADTEAADSDAEPPARDSEPGETDDAEPPAPRDSDTGETDDAEPPAPDDSDTAFDTAPPLPDSGTWTRVPSDLLRAGEADTGEGQLHDTGPLEGCGPVVPAARRDDDAGAAQLVADRVDRHVDLSAFDPVTEVFVLSWAPSCGNAAAHVRFRGAWTNRRDDLRVHWFRPGYGVDVPSRPFVAITVPRADYRSVEGRLQVGPPP